MTRQLEITKLSVIFLKVILQRTMTTFIKVSTKHYSYQADTEYGFYTPYIISRSFIKYE